MSYLYYLILLIQILTAVHVIKTGRSWIWLWIILFFPLVGTAIYVIVEILPDFRRHTFAGMANRGLNTVQPGRELKLLQQEVELADTIQNRRALADYYLRANQPQPAIELYESCLRGAFQDDSDIRLDLCAALLAAQRDEEAKAMLEAVSRRAPAFEPARRELLYARALEALGQASEALTLYERLADKFDSSEEVRWRLAHLLENMGNQEQAKTIYEDMLKRAKRFNPAYRRSQREWINRAKDGAKRLSGD